MGQWVTPEDGMVINADTILTPGVYYLPNGITINANHVTLDGNGAVLIGKMFQGHGVSVSQKTGVTVRNLQIERYYHGIWVNASANVRVLNNRVARTHELAGAEVFLDVWLDRDSAYGCGIFLSGVIDSFVLDNDVQHQQNGVMLYGCDSIEVARNNASFNSGYGILLYQSSLNTIASNTADFCCRIYHYDASGEKYHIGADAAALVVMCSSSKNMITHNRLRGSGDGVFLGGFHKDNLKVPCNDNVFENNDGSNSPNIAFEATFSQRNIFRNNRANNCNYGFWLGYSSATIITGNAICGNRIAGVAIEQGYANIITANQFERNHEGVQLWAAAQPAFVAYYPESAESYDTTISDNTFTRHDAAIHIWSEKNGAGSPLRRCHHFTVTKNTVNANRVGIELARVRASVVQGNHIVDNPEAGIKMIGCQDVSVGANEMEKPVMRT